MKNIISTLLLSALVLTSCSTEDTVDDVIVIGNEVGLKTYTLSKDANGNYTIDYEVNDYTAVEAVTNAETNSNEFYLSTGNIAKEKKKKEELIFNDDYLEVGFYGDPTKPNRGLVIEDDVTAKENAYLESYSVQDLGNDTYQVDFKVKENIKVSFDYNEEENIYEINLKPGVSETQEFSKTFVKNREGFRIDFVNYAGSAKSAKASGTSRKPRVFPMG